MLIRMMTVDYYEAPARMREVIEAVQQGEVIITYFGEPLGTFRLCGPPGEPPPPEAWLEDVVRKGFAIMAEKICTRMDLPACLLN